MDELVAAGFAVVGVSADSAASHARFKAKQGLNFPLVADVEKKTIEAFGAWGEKKMAGRTYMGIIRTTFVIDAGGAVERVITKVDTKNAARQVLESDCNK
jgi:peroxiredoxin Q/BCP